MEGSATVISTVWSASSTPNKESSCSETSLITHENIRQTRRETVVEVLCCRLPEELINIILGFSYHCDFCSKSLSTLDESNVCDRCQEDIQLCRKCHQTCVDCEKKSSQTKELCISCVTICFNKECESTICEDCAGHCIHCSNSCCTSCFEESCKPCSKCHEKACWQCSFTKTPCCDGPIAVCMMCLDECARCTELLCETCVIKCTHCTAQLCSIDSRVCDGGCKKSVCDNGECYLPFFEWTGDDDLFCGNCNKNVVNFCNECLLSCGICRKLVCSTCSPFVSRPLQCCCVNCSKLIQLCNTCDSFLRNSERVSCGDCRTGWQATRIRST